MSNKKFLPINSSDIEIPLIKGGIPVEDSFEKSSRNRKGRPKTCFMKFLSVFTFMGLIFGATVLGFSFNLIGSDQIGYYKNGEGFMGKGIYFNFPWIKERMKVISIRPEITKKFDDVLVHQEYSIDVNVVYNVTNIANYVDNLRKDGCVPQIESLIRNNTSIRNSDIVYLQDFEEKVEECGIFIKRAMIISNSAVRLVNQKITIGSLTVEEEEEEVKKEIEQTIMDVLDLKRMKDFNTWFTNWLYSFLVNISANKSNNETDTHIVSETDDESNNILETTHIPREQENGYEGSGHSESKPIVITYPIREQENSYEGSGHIERSWPPMSDRKPIGRVNPIPREAFTTTEATTTSPKTESPTTTPTTTSTTTSTTEATTTTTTPVTTTSTTPITITTEATTTTSTTTEATSAESITLIPIESISTENIPVDDYADPSYEMKESSDDYSETTNTTNPRSPINLDPNSVFGIAASALQGIH
jgi:hypothetical protein